eukprot:CAMPEP_0172470164 /NCGR_PEP_ID=MMETSP1065-20121228/65637_1 /TAXON_ID=265537 /ORGANISM="Amphiprora paludosa, Strain CCMP125" /LENGTH=636 /DNA_ID=CAMNT_0013228019 /DNA_START=48 /DNA_END=1958 /DNA_ORIENTATION=+
MAFRETEYSSVDQCPFEDVRVEINDGRASVLDTSAAVEVETDAQKGRVAGVISKNGAIVRLQPMELARKNKSPRWTTTAHFHELLQVPSTDKSGLCLLFEARAREGVALALSPNKGFTIGYTYEIILGDRGNTIVTLRRKSSTSGKEDAALVVQRPSRACQENAWTQYWVCLLQGKLYVGLGQQPGERCVAFLDDIARQDQPPAEDKRVRYVGLGNSGTGDRQAPAAVKLRKIKLFAMTESIISNVKGVKEKDLEFIAVGEEEMDDETKALLVEYQEECKKARVRAEKFGVPYKEPPTFIPWSHARRLRANPQQGFITGLDLAAPDEQSKQEARKKRFGIQTNEAGKDDKDEPSDKVSTEMQTEKTEDVLPTEQAWENENFVRAQRTDPPVHLWKEPVATPLEGDKKGSTDGFEAASPANASLTPDKVHLFSIDWAAFKQIRTNDIMKYFGVYGPTYVEWLGDLSCNVHFQDKFSASRAMENLSTALPFREEETGDAPKVDLGRMGWRLGKTLLLKIANDRFGRRGTTARVLLRTATSLDVLHERPSSWPKPPPGFSTKRILGPGSDHPQTKKKSKKKRKSDARDDSGADEQEESRNEEGAPSILDCGLKATRPGFSTEELEKERAKKRSKTTGSE